MAHRLAEIRLQVNPEGNERNLGNSNRLLRTFSLPLGDVQNKVVKGKVIFLEPWSGISGFLHCSLRPRKAVTSENRPGFREIILGVGSFLSQSFEPRVFPSVLLLICNVVMKGPWEKTETQNKTPLCVYVCVP